jgi:hypothetical protein
MAGTTRLLSEIVTEICTRLNDTQLVKYADSTTYLGRAADYFFSTVRQMLDDPRSYGMKELDYRGVLEREEVVIGTVSAENGLILYSALTAIPSKVIDIYTNSDSSNDQLGYNIVSINEEYPEFAENVETYSNFYCPTVNTDLDVGWYLVETGIQFYPKGSTGKGANYVTVKYIPDASPDDYTKDTEFYIGGTNGLYTLKFIDKAISIVTAKLLAERNI